MALRASFFDVAVVRVRVWKPINPIIPEATDQDGGKCDPVNYNFQLFLALNRFNLSDCFFLD